MSGSCSVPSIVRSDDSVQERVSICNVLDDFERYQGRKVLIAARYLSDGVHEEVLEDLGCAQGRRIIDIGRRSDSTSVLNFYAARKKICADRGEEHLCNTSAMVEISGTIGVLSGDVVIDVSEVNRFRFAD